MAGDNWVVDGKPVAASGGVKTGSGDPAAGWAVDGKSVDGSGDSWGAGISKYITTPLTTMLGGLLDPFGQGVQNLKGIVKAQKEANIRSFSAPTLSERVGYKMASALPIVGPAAASVGEDYGEGNFKTGTVGAATLLGPSAIKATRSIPIVERGVQAVSNVAESGLRKMAKSQYAQAIRPTGMRNRGLAKDVVVPGALNRRMIAGSDEGLLEQAQSGMKKAQAKMDAGENAIINRQNAALVNAKLTGTAPGAPVQTFPAQPMIDWLENLRTDPQRPSVVNGQIVNPVKNAAITHYQNLIREAANADPFSQTTPITPALPNAVTTSTNPYGAVLPYKGTPTGQISEGALLSLRRGIDDMIQGKHLTIPGTDTPAPLNVTKPLSNYLRDVFNQAHPDLAQAFRDYRFFRSFDVLQRRKIQSMTGAPSNGLVGSSVPWIAGAIEYGIHGSPWYGAGAAAAFKALYSASRSTLWRTLSSVTKWRLADTIANGRFAQTMEILKNAGYLANASGVDINWESENPVDGQPPAK